MIKKRFGISILILLILSLTVYAATRPTQGGSNNNWGTELNTWLDVAHTSEGQIKSGHITSNMILDYTVSNSDIALNSVNGTQIVSGVPLNVSSMVLNINSSTERLATAANISGIYINKTYIDVPPLASGLCVAIDINMTGLPQNAFCIPMLDFSFNANASLANFTVDGMNSTMSNCRLRVCNRAAVGPSVDLNILQYSALAIVTGGT